MWTCYFGVSRFAVSLRPAALLAPLADLTGPFPPSQQGLLPPSFRPSRSPSSPSDISTVASGHLHRQDFHLLERKLASLHRHTRVDKARAAGSDHTSLDVRKPIVVDEHGNPRIVLEVADLGPSLTLSDEHRKKGAWQQLLMARAIVRLFGSGPSDGSSQRRYGNTIRGEIKRANPGTHEFVSVVVGQIARELNVSLCDVRARWGGNRA